MNYCIFCIAAIYSKSRCGVDFSLEAHYCLKTLPHISYLWIKQGVMYISFEKFIMRFEIPLFYVLLHCFKELEN